MLKTLRLINFKRHADTLIEFTSGLNLITGANYKGKSTLLQGVMYALGGPTSVPGGAGVVRRKGGGPASVELELDINNDTYKVVRKEKGATLMRNGEEIAKSTSAVTTHLAELLGMDAKRLAQLRYGKQKETEALLTLGAGELHKIIGEISQADVINNTITKCSDAATFAKGHLSALADIDIKSLEGKHAELSEAAALDYTYLTNQHAALVTKSQELEAATEEHRRLCDISNDNRVLRDLQAAIDRKLEDAKQRLYGATKNMEATAGAEAVLEEANRALRTFSDQLAKQEAEHKYRGDAEANLVMLKSRLQASYNLRQALTEQLSQLGPQVETLESDTGELDLKRDQRAEWSATVNNLASSLSSSVCPSCGRPYENLEEGWKEKGEAELEYARGTLSELDASIGNLMRAVATGTRHNQQLQALNDKLDSALDTIKHQEVDVKKADEAFAKLPEIPDERAYKELLDAATNLQTRVNTSQKQVTEHARASQTADLARVELEKLEKERSELPVPVEADDPMEKQLEVDALQRSYQVLHTSYSENEGAYRTLLGEIERITKQIEQGKEHASKRKALSERIANCDALAKYLRKNRDRFMADVWEGITDYASEFASACTGGDINSIARTEKGEFTYTEGEHTYPVAAASGAQRSILGLGVQIAMSQILPCAIGTMLLDEPSSDMDEERSLSLSSLLSSTREQILMVSHRALDGAVADNTIHL